MTIAHSILLHLFIYIYLIWESLSHYNRYRYKQSFISSEKHFVVTMTYKLSSVDLDAFAPFKVSNFICFVFVKILIKIEDKNQDFFFLLFNNLKIRLIYVWTVNYPSLSRIVFLSLAWHTNYLGYNLLVCRNKSVLDQRNF